MARCLSLSATLDGISINFREENDILQILESYMPSGVIQLAYESTTVTLGATYSFDIYDYGDQIHVYKDGLLIASVSTTYSQGNIIGFYNREWASTTSHLHEITVRAFDQPTAPIALTAASSSGTQIELTWTDNATNETGFIVERSPDGRTGWTQISTPAADATSFSDTTVTVGQKWYYRVKATHPNGDSGYTEVISATALTTHPRAT